MPQNLYTNWLLGALFASIACCLPAQSMDREAYLLYADGVLDEEVPECNRQGDAECVFRLLDELVEAGLALEEWEGIFHGLGWKMHYSNLFSRQDQYYRTLKRTSELLQAAESKAAPELFHDTWVNTQLRWGRYYYDRGDWALALERYAMVRDELLERPGLAQRDISALSDLHISMGVIYRDQGAYDLAEAYLLKGIDYKNQEVPKLPYSGFVAIAHKHLGDLFFKKADYPLALGQYQQAINIYEHTDTTYHFYRNGLSSTHIGKALVYQAMGEFDLAIQSLLIAQRTDGSAKGIDYNLWFHLSEVYAEQGQLGQAYAALDRAFERRLETFGLKHYKTAEAFAAYGHLAAQQNDWPCALDHYQAALVSLVEGFDAHDITANPWAFERNFIKKDIVGLFAHKIAALRQWSAASGDAAHLHTAWATVEAAVHAISLLRSGLPRSEADKLLFFQESAQVFEQGLLVAWALGPGYHAAAFELAEQNKALILLEAFRQAQALRLAGIPDSLLEREAQLSYEIAVTEDAVFKKRASKAPLRDHLLALQAAQTALLQAIEAEYPDYYRLRYGEEGLSLPALQQGLGRRQAVAAFSTGEEASFAFVVQPGSIAMHLLPAEGQLRPLVEALRQGIYGYFLSEDRSAGTYEAAAEQYVAHAHELYRLLFAPFADGLPQDLLLLPDGVLGYLPFEALLTQLPEGQPARFKSHPYLLRRHRIGYCYSASLWQEMRQNASDNRQLAAFAPAFPNQHRPNSLAVRAELDTLYFNQPEVLEIAALLQQPTPYLGGQATKARFMQQAPKAGLLHIASHGVANDTASGYSFVAFTAAHEQPDSNRLYARELYSMRLQAAMVVLSACETGTGELKKGEGIISLARAFAYAGAQSVLSTLWPVNDESTTYLMRHLYQNMRAGQPKSQALQAAKLAYMDSRNEDLAAHPFYWSATIAMGDMRPLYGSRAWVWWALGLAFVSCGLWWAIVKTRSYKL